MSEHVSKYQKKKQERRNHPKVDDNVSVFDTGKKEEARIAKALENHINAEKKTERAFGFFIKLEILDRDTNVLVHSVFYDNADVVQAKACGRRLMEALADGYIIRSQRVDRKGRPVILQQ